MGAIRVLVIGDIVGEPGRRVCETMVPALRQRERLDFVVANGENIAAGSGITEATLQTLLQNGVDVVTTGDHVFKKREVYDLLKRSRRILRPANYPVGAHGFGSSVYDIVGMCSIGVVNLLGRVFLQTVDCPFQRITPIVEELRQKTRIVIIDFHAEATSEKIAMGWYLDGKVSCVYGTHTHVQTADETILPQGTAYITDIGMTGPCRSVLGRDIEAVLHRFTTQMPAHFAVARDDIRLHGAIVEIDIATGKAVSIRRIEERLSE
jgi:metallophosphoesterase (TIGR00282 family)